MAPRVGSSSTDSRRTVWRQFTVQLCGQFLFRGWRVRTTRHARQSQTKAAPLFPGYLLVAFDPTIDRWRSIRGTRGVIRLLAAGDSPLRLPFGVAEALGAPPEARDAVVPPVEDEPVRLTSGPFAGLVGQLIRLDSNGRVEVLLRILGEKGLDPFDATS